MNIWRIWVPSDGSGSNEGMATAGPIPMESMQALSGNKRILAWTTLCGHGSGIYQYDQRDLAVLFRLSAEYYHYHVCSGVGKYAG